MPADLGYAGFKLTFPLKGEDQQNQFMVFAGASYYRAVGSENNFASPAAAWPSIPACPAARSFRTLSNFGWNVRHRTLPA
ncbi:glucan biosynthesis protein [Halopseudomonas pachastrellae]|nr:glucan biosynthesis protein [Halopseudomonas pachastrellae]